MSTEIRHASALLQGITDGLRSLSVEAAKRRSDVKLGSLEVVFVAGAESYEFGLVEALDAIANDTYWDERGCWAEATEAIVRVI